MARIPFTRMLLIMKLFIPTIICVTIFGILVSVAGEQAQTGTSESRRYGTGFCPPRC